MYFRMHHFVVEFSKKKFRLRRQRGIDPVIKILLTFLPLTLIDCACYLWPLLDRLSSGGVAIRHLLPVLWMTTCLHLIPRHKRQEKSVDSTFTQSDSPGGSIGPGGDESGDDDYFVEQML